MSGPAPPPLLLLKAALRRRACLLAAALVACSGVLAAFASSSGLFSALALQGWDAARALARAGLWMLPLQASLLPVVYFFFLETVCLENRVYDIRNTVYLLLSPIVVGSVWGFCLCQILSRSLAPYSAEQQQLGLKLSIVAAIASVAVFSARRRAEGRHQYMIAPAAPPGARSLAGTLLGLLPGAAGGALAAALLAALLELGGGAGARLLAACLSAVSSLSAGIDLVGMSHIVILRRLLSVLQLVVRTLLFLLSQCIVLARCTLLLATSLFSSGGGPTVSGSYHFFLVFLIVYLILSLSEEAMRVVIFHPLKFSKLAALLSPSSQGHSQSTLLAEALACVLPARVPSAVALLELDSAERAGVGTPRRGRPQGTRPAHLWLQTLTAQLDVADAVLQGVRPSPDATCPSLPSLVPSSGPGEAGLFAGFDDAAAMLMLALAAHDWARSARVLHALDSSGSLGGAAVGGGDASPPPEQRRDLLDSEREALPLATQDWCRVALSSCAIIDATALQFTLAAAFIEDQITQNNAILATPDRMTERQLAQAVLEACLAHFPLPSFVGNVLSAVKDMLVGLVIRRKAPAAAPSGGSASASDGIHSHSHMPKGVSLPVIVSQEQSAGPDRRAGGEGDNGLDNRLKVGSFVASQLIEKGRIASANSWWGKFSLAWYSYMLRNEINRSGILDLLLSTAIGQRRSRSLLDSIKTRGVPACPAPAVAVQACVHAMEAVTLVMGLGLQSRRGDGSSHVAACVTSLLGLQVAVQNHRNAYRKYTSRRSSSSGGSGGGGAGLAGGKEFISHASSDGGVIVAQTPWVSGDVQVSYAIYYILL
jgi:hypothetical protein